LTLANNTCNDNGHDGIESVYSDGSIIANNTCHNNGGKGIDILLSDSVTINSNAVENNGYDAISLSDSSSSTVTNNICKSNNGSGVFLCLSGSSNITNNTFIDDGLYFKGFVSLKEEVFSYTVANNSVNELPLGYIVNETDVMITEDYGQLILINCNKTVVKDQNYSNTSVGIALYYCYENQLVNNTCSNNDRNGIFLWSSSFSTITNNT